MGSEVYGGLLSHVYLTYCDPTSVEVKEENVDR